MRAMIVDDEAPARSELKFLLEETGRLEEIIEATSARDAVEKLMESRVEVLFLDISMPKTNGMQLAEALHKLKNPPQIVFVTAYSEYALDAFGVNAVDYLMKPVETERLEQALDKVEERLRPQSPMATSEFLSLRAEARFLFLLIRFALLRQKTIILASTQKTIASCLLFLCKNLKSALLHTDSSAFIVALS